MSGADQLDTIKDSLRQVTTGLAVAFDATFVALVASILVMLPMTWLQKAEDKLVNDVDDYCATHVLSRLGGQDRPAVPAVEAPAALDPAEMRKILVEALAQPLADLLSANARVLERMRDDRRALADAGEALLAQIFPFAAAFQQAGPAAPRSRWDRAWSAWPRSSPPSRRAPPRWGRAWKARWASSSGRRSRSPSAWIAP
jgi:hypothetical protein